MASFSKSIRASSHRLELEHTSIKRGKGMKRGSKGFTLIELLVVIAIIGILAAIAIPQFSAYRKRGFAARAKSDLRNVATAEEAYFVDSEKYLSCTGTQAGGSCTALPGFDKASNGVTVTISLTSSTATYFTGSGVHAKGQPTSFSWNSANGGLQP